MGHVLLEDSDWAVTAYVPTQHCACNAGLPGARMQTDTAGCESAVFCVLSKWMCFLMNQDLEITNCIVFSFWGLDGREVQHLD